MRRVVFESSVVTPGPQRSCRRRAVSLALCVALGLLWSTEASARDRRLPTQLRLVILFKALTYDRNLARQRGKLVVGIVCDKTSSASRALGYETAAELSRMAGKRVKGLKLSHTLLSVKNGKALTRRLNEHGINVIYLSTAVGRLLPRMRALARERGLLIISGEAEHIRQGASLAVVQRGPKPRILFNLTVAREQGASLDARLLSLSDVIF